MLAAVVFGSEKTGGCLNSRILPKRNGCAIESGLRKTLDSDGILLGLKQGEGGTAELG